MESLDYWRLCDEFSIVQAALLIVGQNADDANYIEQWDACNRPIGYEAAKTALTNAILFKKLKAYVEQDMEFIEYDYMGEHFERYEAINQISLTRTVIKSEDLKKWLISRGIKTGFFFEDNNQQPDYLNSSDPNYSSKLAAAIDVWQAMSENPNLIKASSPKQAISKWLRLNASKYNLVKDDGNPNEQGIEEIAKVVNWQTKGGAPKTPISGNPTTHSD